jgi:hypothetical protein
MQEFRHQTAGTALFVGDRGIDSQQDSLSCFPIIFSASRGHLQNFLIIYELAFQSFVKGLSSSSPTFP